MLPRNKHSEINMLHGGNGGTPKGGLILRHLGAQKTTLGPIARPTRGEKIVHEKGVPFLTDQEAQILNKKVEGKK